MTEQDKQLLLKDLCARLPYGLKVELTKYKQKCHLCGIDGEDLYLNIDSDPFSLRDFDIKPYLRPMSSMTDEENKYYNKLTELVRDGEAYEYEVTDWLNAHHFDYRGLIPMGLALEAPEGMYKVNNI